MRYSKTTIIGNIGKDCQLREVGDSTVASFSVAVQAFKKDGKPTWFNCSLWGKRAIALNPYLVKGQGVLVDGEISIREYTKDGKHGVSIELRASDVVLVGTKPSGQRPSYDENRDCEGPGGSFDPGEIPF